MKGAHEMLPMSEAPDWLVLSLGYVAAMGMNGVV
jgi:hypothetical protein